MTEQRVTMSGRTGGYSDATPNVTVAGNSTLMSSGRSFDGGLVMAPGWALDNPNLPGGGINPSGAGLSAAEIGGLPSTGSGSGLVSGSITGAVLGGVLGTVFGGFPAGTLLGGIQGGVQGGVIGTFGSFASGVFGSLAAEALGISGMFGAGMFGAGTEGGGEAGIGVGGLGGRFGGAD